MLWSRWRAGPQAGAQGRLLVSFTDFTANGWFDLPGAFRAGLSLREGWPRMPGAVGIWLWAAPMSRRCGSLSIWTDEASLREFVRTPDHLAIVKAYRGRGAMRPEMWVADAGLPRRELRAMAEARVSGSSWRGHADIQVVERGET